MTKRTDLTRILHDEVSLVGAVKSCTDCNWFWGATPPYGPFPAFDWEERFPKAILDGPSNDEDDCRYWTKVTQVHGERVEPAVLRGCRKAPIMTVGINPNMTAFFAGASSSTWAYPFFKNEETYAYYYRHATIFQESFDLDDLRQQIIPGSEIRAEHDGSVSIQRSNTHRWLSMEFNYKDQTPSSQSSREEAWLPDERLVIFARDHEGAETIIFPAELSGVMEHEVWTPLPETHINIIASDADAAHNPEPARKLGALIKGIKKGDLIAAKIAVKEHKNFDLYANKTGYYDRATPILRNFNQYLHSQGFPNARLSIGEDISMHDMVACASPGWNEDQYGIPIAHIANKCVSKNQFMFDQLVQSKPRIVVIVSVSSLNMFANYFVDSFGGRFDLNYEGKDAFELLKETSATRYTLSWGKGKDAFSSRILITPHFSYASNFYEQSRFSSESWQAFVHDFPDDFETLNNDGDETQKKRKGWRVDNKHHTVFVTATLDPIREKISDEAWSVLMQCHIAPYELIQLCLASEHEHQPLMSNASTQHLDRAVGSCSFCVNEKWAFPEGCDYGLAGISHSAE